MVDIVYYYEPLGIYALAEGLLHNNIVWFVTNQALLYKFDIKFKKNITPLFTSYRNEEIIFSCIDIINDSKIMERHETCKLSIFFNTYCYLGSFFFSKKYAIQNMQVKIQKLKQKNNIILSESEKYIYEHPELLI